MFIKNLILLTKNLKMLFFLIAKKKISIKTVNSMIVYLIVPLIKKIPFGF